jgi:hypothetical protein
LCSFSEHHGVQRRGRARWVSGPMNGASQWSTSEHDAREDK